MKIWVQSGTPIGVSDVYAPYLESLKKHAKRICRPDTVCEFPSLGKVFPGAARSRTQLHLVSHEAIKNAMRAEKEGFDVFVTQTLDYGFREIREVINIPIVYMAQATLSFYSLLAPNFAFIVNSERLHHLYPELAERYQIKERMVPGGFVTFPYTDYANLWKNPQPYIEAFMKVAKEIVSRGATSLFPAGLYLSQWLIDQNIKEVDGAIIMEPLTIGIKMAELMVDLEGTGIKRCQIGPYAAPSEEVREILAKELSV